MNKDNNLPRRIYEKMMEKDNFTKWLGLELLKIGEGFCVMSFTIKADMLNGFDTVHGGVLFAASDSVFAFACNSHGLISVALEVSISFANPAKLGEVLIVKARKLHLSRKIGLYEVRVEKEDRTLISLFKGTAYRTSRIF